MRERELKMPAKNAANRERQIMRRGDSVPAVDAFYGSVARVQPCQ